MENYLTIVSRDQFINLYRFGKLNIPNNFIITKEYILELLTLLQCEYDEDCLILDIKYIKNHMLDKIDILYNLKIQDVKSIYVLSHKAKNYYEPKFNSKIRFKIYPNSDILKLVQNHRELDDIESGVNALIEQFDIINKDKIEEELGKDFNIKIIESLKNENYLKEKYTNFYVDLLSYKRESFFPKGDVGYLYDLIVITVLKDRNSDRISKFKQGNLSIKSIKTYQKLKENENKTLLEYIKYIENTNDENIKKFLDVIEGIKYLIIGSLFLKIKNILLEKDIKYHENICEIIDIFKKNYKNELAISLYLIGLVFGYKELYEDYYNSIPLDIFSDKKEDNSYDNDQANLESENQKLKDENKILSQKLIDSDKELKIYKEKVNDILSTDIEFDIRHMASVATDYEQKSSITLDIQTISDKNIIGKTGSENILTPSHLDTTVINNIQDENLNIDNSKVTEQKIIKEKFNKDSFQSTEELFKRQQSVKEFLEFLDIKTLVEIYYRKDTKKRKIKELKKQYNSASKNDLIDLIVNDNIAT